MNQKHHFRWLALLAFLLAGFATTAQAQGVDDLQDYLDLLAQEQQAPAPRLTLNRIQEVTIPIGLPVVDLSQFTSYEQRTKVLTVRTSAKFINGTISSSATRAESGPLLKIMDGATVVVASSAGVTAAAASQGVCANNYGLTQTVGIFGGSTFYQECDVVAPGGNEANEAIHLATAADSYYHVSGTRVGIVHNPNGGTVVEGTSTTTEWTIGTGGDFASVNAAMDDSRVTAGHTLRLLPGTRLSATQKITKSVTLLGNGYSMNSSGVFANDVAGIATLEVRAEGAIVKDVALMGSNNLKIYANNITIEGCCMYSLWAYQNLETDNAIVKKCYITGGIEGNDSYEWTVQNNIILGGVIELEESTIDHNIIYSDRSSTATGYCLDELFDCIVSNNIITHFQSDMNYTGTFNGVAYSGTLSEESDNTFARNVFTGTTTLSNNKGGVTQENQLFVGGYRYTDAFFKLVTNSPAMNYATDGTDCGPWSGTDPYVCQAEEAPIPLSGTLTLDLNQTDNPAQGIYKTLFSLFSAIGTRGFSGELNVTVAEGSYTFDINDDTYAVLQAVGQQLNTQGNTLKMTCSTSATFYFTMSDAFISAHGQQLEAMSTAIKTLLQKITLTNIVVYLNGVVIISDFQVEENDLVALRNLYDHLGGTGWTTKKWNFANNGMLKSDFPGVSFNSAGRVTAINLSNNGLTGSCYEIPATHFTELKTLNLSRNSISGNLGILVGNLKKLSSLNMDHNRLYTVSKTLTTAPATVSVKYQNRVYQSSNPEQAAFTGNVSGLSAKAITLAGNMTFTLPTLMSYSFSDRNFSERPTLRLSQTATPTEAVAILVPSDDGTYYQLQFSGVYSEAQDKRMMLIDTNGTWSQWSAYPATVHWVPGDANMSGETNVLDVQYTLRYILAPSALTYFNYSAANTYNDNTINVQDCVVTVNIVLDNGLAPAASRSDSPFDVVYEGNVWMEGGRLMLSADRDVAAIDVELQGVSTDEVALMLNRSDFQMAGRNTEWGSRYVIFSPTGKRIAAGDVAQLLRVSGQAQPVAIQCADTDAQEVAIALGTMPSGIKEISDTDGDSQMASGKSSSRMYFDLQGRRTDGSRKGVYVQHGKKVIVR